MHAAVEDSAASSAGSTGTSLESEAADPGQPGLQHYTGRISISGRARYTEQNGQVRSEDTPAETRLPMD